MAALRCMSGTTDGGESRMTLPRRLLLLGPLAAGLARPAAPATL
jgi:hypothetical protein